MVGAWLLAESGPAAGPVQTKLREVAKLLQDLQAENGQCWEAKGGN